MPAVKQALGIFAGGKTHTTSQIRFVNLIIDHLAEHRVAEPATFYESPFADATPRGPQGLFERAELEESLLCLKAVKIAVSTPGSVSA